MEAENGRGQLGGAMNFVRCSFSLTRSPYQHDTRSHLCISFTLEWKVPIRQASSHRCDVSSDSSGKSILTMQEHFLATSMQTLQEGTCVEYQTIPVHPCSDFRGNAFSGRRSTSLRLCVRVTQHLDLHGETNFSTTGHAIAFFLHFAVENA